MIVKEKEKKLMLRGTIKRVYKMAGKAMHDYDMLQDKDRVMVGVSGGRDSLSLLEILLMRKARIPIDFSLVVCCVDMGLKKGHKKRLVDYFETKEVEYVIKELSLDKEDLDCFWCSWNRRKILFNAAREFNCNKLALAHHLDDITETILLNMFSRGEISAMKPKLSFFEGEVVMIRPFSYLEKVEIEAFASNLGLLSYDWDCPMGKENKRQALQESISRLRKDFPYIKMNIFRALRKDRIKQDYLV